MFQASPSTLRSGVLPSSALAHRPIGPPSFPPSPPPGKTPLRENLQNHTLDMMFIQVLRKPCCVECLRFH